MLNAVLNNKKIVIITLIVIIILTISLVYFNNIDTCDNMCTQDVVRCPGTNAWAGRDPCNNCKPKCPSFNNIPNYASNYIPNLKFDFNTDDKFNLKSKSKPTPTPKPTPTHTPNKNCDNVCPQDIVKCPGTNMWAGRDPCNDCKPKCS